MKSFLIIGAGSLGSLFGAKLGLAGAGIRAICSPKITQIINRNGINIKDLKGKLTKVDNFKILNPNAFHKQDFLDLCIIATKAFSLESICQQYYDIISQFSNIVLLQNGLGNEEIIRKFYPQTKIFRIVTSNGAILEENTVSHTGKGESYFCIIKNPDEISDIELSMLPQDVQNLFDYCEKAELKPSIAENSDEMIWRKALVNIGVNAFGALTHLTNGELLKINDIPQLITNTIQEAIFIAEDCSINLKKDFNYVQNTFNILEKTSKNKNSMLQDIMNHRPTEIDFLNGYIVILGKRKEIPTPLNQILTALIKGNELSFTTKEMELNS